MTLQITGIKTLEQVRAFVEGNQAVSFVLNDRRSAHRWLMETLKRFRYELCSKIDKGLLRAYICKITGLSRAQVTRLITQPA